MNVETRNYVDGHVQVIVKTDDGRPIAGLEVYYEGSNDVAESYRVVSSWRIRDRHGNTPRSHVEAHNARTEHAWVQRPPAPAMPAGSS